MDDITILLSGIDNKVRMLVNQLEKALKDKEQLLEENEKLKEEVKSRENDIEEFEKQNKLLKIAKSIESLEGKKEVKQKINELVREIDNCIALLNR